jgi:predicted histidine transporter YuiF (NhaC family)
LNASGCFASYLTSNCTFLSLVGVDLVGTDWFHPFLTFHLLLPLLLSSAASSVLTPFHNTFPVFVPPFLALFTTNSSVLFF